MIGRYACLFAPETSCEFANRYLDRLLLTEGLGHAWQSYFFDGEERAEQA